MNSKSVEPKLRFNNFSDEWKLENLGALYTFKNGINAAKEQYGHGHKFINVLDVLQDLPITEQTIIGLVDVDDKTLIKNAVENGDLLFQRSSETREEVGTSNVYLGQEAVTFGGFVIRGKPIRQVNAVYMNYLLKSSKARQEIVTKSGGSTRYNVGQATLSAVEIFLSCNNDEQQKIADFLTAVDCKISLLTEKHRLLNEYKKGAMQQLFSQQLRFKDKDGNAFPEWKEDRLDSFIKRVNDPVDVEQTTEYCQIGIRCHGKGIFHKDKVTGAEIGNKRVFWVHTKALVINIVFAWERAIAVTSENEKGFIASHRFPMYVPVEDKSDLDYLLYFFLSPRGEFLLNLASPGGAGRNKTLGQAEFSRLKVKLPSLAEQQKIAQFLQAIDNKITAVAEQIEQTKQFKKGLLQQMFV